MTHRAGVWLCLLLSLAFFGDALWGDRTLIPSGFLYQSEPWKSAYPQTAGDPAQQYDLLYQFYPWALHFKQAVARGEFPLWNPYNYLGTPFFANPQTALLFPPSWLHLALPLRYSFSLIFMLKLVLMTTGMLFWLRGCGLRAEACLLGALVFGLSMHSMVSMAFPYSNVTALLPWVLLAARRTARRPSGGGWTALVLVLATAVLAGQPQSALAAFLAVALLLAVEAAAGRSSLRGLAASAAAFAAAALLTAVQWAPSFEYAAESMVPEGPRIIHSGLPYLSGNLVSFVIPDFFGSHLRGDFWGFPGYHDAAFYSSILALLLVPLAFRRDSAGSAGIPARNRSDSPTAERARMPALPARREAGGAVFAAILALLSVGLLLGIPVLENLLDLPGFDLMRRNKFVFLLIFSLAELSARGADSIGRRLTFQPSSRRERFAPVLAAALLATAALTILWHFQPYLDKLDPQGHTLRQALHSGVFLVVGAAVLGMRPRRWTMAVLPLLVVLDLAPLSYGLNPRGSANELYPKLPSAAQTPADTAPARIYSLDQSIFTPNAAQVYGIQDVRGYDVMTPRRLFRFMQAVDPALGDEYTRLQGLDRTSIDSQSRMVQALDIALQAYGDPLREYLESESYWTVGISAIRRPELFDLLQVDHLLLDGGRPPDGYLPEGEIWKGIRSYANPAARRAQLYLHWTAAQPQKALQAMRLETDLQRTAVVEASLPAPPAESSLDAGTVELLDWQTQSRRYETESSLPAVFVEFERFADGWTAKVDGQEQPVFPAQSIFRGVYLTPGRHEVRLQYRPSSFRYGLLISALGVLLTAAGIRMFRARPQSRS